MASERQLPATHNPLLIEDVPPHSELIARRRLGQTELTPRMVTIAAHPEIDTTSLGAFDYAHLRAPLPKGIVSGIFKSSPPSYFLMRRSQDGYVSATGMFKATFPYADQEEEELERKYIKSLPTTSHEETAGNVWIPPEQALALAEEYKILPWIRALLDPADIAVTTGTDGKPPKKITAPPKFFCGQPALAPPVPNVTRASLRSRRSVSPTKSTGTKRAIASPRKRRVASSQSSITSEAPQSSAKEPTPSPLANSEAPSQLTADTLVNGENTSFTYVPAVPTTSVAKLESEDDGQVKMESIEKEPAVVLAPVEEEPKIKVHVDQDVKVDSDGEEVKHTKVEVEVPLLGELPSAEDAARMVAEAKAMVEAAAKTVADNAIPAESSLSSSKNKRKADEIAEDEDGEKAEGTSDEPQAKKAKTEAEIRKEKMRKRAFMGITATLTVGAVGALIPMLGPYVMSVL
ncbi:hypothetical protein QBC46DRAFT_39453 [Diplogelasinospora grovesii]|uniref:HTH APSES-type domain-containing protein n=1 Tax=Diplogelasinospora grovesii TaxID=303347 RepID=A0AAN6NCN4_9PEZI|nr:hypothetical protein QBC46DRAFT_39453 [Diplogelasinospora grovesii]